MFRKYHPVLKFVNSSLVDLPCPASITINWNYGSCLGLTLVVQLITGIILATRYTSSSLLSFDSVVLIFQDSGFGWFLRLLHSTGASFFFLFTYLHIARGLYYGSYVKKEVWNIGVIIYLLLMGTAFLGYVLPWGQMSFWAATVITNLLSALPYVGGSIVTWVWGGFAVGSPTLVRFFALHYLLPFVVCAMVVFHFYYLHEEGSTNPLGVNSSGYKVMFHYYFSVKDVYVFTLYLFMLILGSLTLGYTFMDAENFLPANSLVTPTHIQPEWYFLFAYAILRSIPNKLGGVVGLVLAVVILFLPSVITPKLSGGVMYSWLHRMLFWWFCSSFLILTWLGSCAAEPPYVLVSQVFTGAYFVLFLVVFM